MSKKQPIKVTIKETRHKKQPWTISIDMPGNNPKDMPQERYTRLASAKRGALRKLRAFTQPKDNGEVWCAYTDKKLNFREIQFAIVRR